MTCKALETSRIEQALDFPGEKLSTDNSQHPCPAVDKKDNWILQSNREEGLAGSVLVKLKFRTAW
jgi:hypothetical protein